MKQINLLPKIEQRQIGFDLLTQKLIRFGFLVLSLLVIVFLLSLGSQIYLRKKMTSLKQEIAGQEALLTSSDNQELQKQVVDLNQQIRTIEQLKGQHLEWSKVLIELTNLLPTDMRVTTLGVDRASLKLTITGTAENRDSVLKFWSNVKKSRYFTDINFPLINLEKPTSTPYTYTLTINAEALKQ